MRANTSAASAAVRLAVRKNSIFGPLILLLLTIFLFVVYALPSEYGRLAPLLGLDQKNAVAADIITRAGKVFTEDDPTLRNKMWAEVGSSPWRFLTEVLRPLLKAYLEQLATDFRSIILSVVVTLLTLVLYSLIPGLAGLIYRRNFTFWFFTSFAALFTINASGLFPSLAGGAEPMPGSGKILLFVLSQIVIVLFAFRLRRHSTNISRLPPRLYNWSLAGLLTVIGVACWQGWGPGTGDPADAAGDPRAGYRDCSEAYCPALAEVKGGSFTMGSNESTDFAFPGAHPPHSVTLKEFYIGKFEITHDEWDACVSEGGCSKIEATFGRGRRPVEVGFDEANRFAAWLSKKTGKAYRLPSEAEWEYAARAGPGGRYYFGDSPDELSAHAWYKDITASGAGGAKIHLVGRKKPNGLGLYDIYGNVSEWVEDCTTMNYSSAPTDGSAWKPADCRDHVVRGGVYWLDNPFDFTSAKRHEPPGEIVEVGKPQPLPKSGFRLVREAGGGVPAVSPQIKLGAVGNPDADYVSRSWIWGFLGSDFTGWIYKWEFILVGLPLVYTLMRNSAAWTKRKRKNIVICIDGTSNTPDQIDQGFAATTNVYKLFRMLKVDIEGAFEPGELFDASLCKRYDEKQIAFYYAGVGNKYDNDAIRQIFGLAGGLGAEEIVERAYLDLVRIFQKNDRVFIFGFSRGAAIARLLARSIDARGAPRSVWTIKLLGKHRTLWSSKTKQPVPISVLGCWDTVGSFGVAKTIGGINFQQLNMGRDLSVPENVEQAYHMVALDEQRDSFEPTLMDPDPNRPERIVEVWFAGDHANIGGGWATDRLSDITLDFLLRRVSSGYAESEELAGREDEKSWGLYLKAWKADKAEYWERQDDNPHIVDPDPLGQIQQWFSHLYQYQPRKMPQHAVIWDDVFNRMVESLPVYAPQALFNLNDELDRRRDLIDAQVAKLTKSGLLSDEDLGKIEGYKKKLRLNRFADYWNNTLLPAREGKFDPPEKVLAHWEPSKEPAST